MTRESVLNQYITPFGAMSKSEFEIQLFMSLQDEEYFGKGKSYDLYAIQSKLKITKAKARNLVYAAELRRPNHEDKLDNALARTLFEAHFFYEKDSRNISLEIENPRLIDYLKHKLKEMGHITDASFSPDIIKMSIDAYSSILESYRKKNEDIDRNIKSVYKKMVSIGAIKDTSLAATIKTLLLSVSRIAGGKLVEEVVGSGYDFLQPILTGKCEELLAALKDLLDKNE